MDPKWYKRIPLSKWIIIFIIIYMTGLSNNINRPRQEILDNPPIFNFLSGFSLSLNEVPMWFFGHMTILIYGYMIYITLLMGLLFIYPILGWFFTNNYVGNFEDLFINVQNDEKETLLQLILITLGFCICTIIYNNLGIIIIYF